MKKTILAGAVLTAQTAYADGLYYSGEVITDYYNVGSVGEGILLGDATVGYQLSLDPFTLGAELRVLGTSAYGGRDGEYRLMPTVTLDTANIHLAVGNPQTAVEYLLPAIEPTFEPYLQAKFNSIPTFFGYSFFVPLAVGLSSLDQEYMTALAAVEFGPLSVAASYSVDERTVPILGSTDVEYATAAIRYQLSDNFALSAGYAERLNVTPILAETIVGIEATFDRFDTSLVALSIVGDIFGRDRELYIGTINFQATDALSLGAKYTHVLTTTPPSGSDPDLTSGYSLSATYEFNDAFYAQGVYYALDGVVIQDIWSLSVGYRF